MDKFKKVIADVEKMKQQMKDKLQKSLKECFVDLFDKHPDLLAVAWSQYTPYFNDGEPCEFAVHDVHDIALVPSAAKRAIDLEYRRWDGKKAFVRPSNPWIKDEDTEREYFSVDDLSSTSDFSQLAEDVKSLSKAMCNLDDMMKSIFGDHVAVIADRDGFHVQDLDHE